MCDMNPSQGEESKTSLVSVGDMINSGMLVDKNCVDYKMIQATLHLMAGQMRLLNSQVDLRINQPPKDKAKQESEEVTCCLSEETIARVKCLESKVKDWKDKKAKDDIEMEKKTKGIEGKDVSSDVEGVTVGAEYEEGGERENRKEIKVRVTKGRGSEERVTGERIAEERVAGESVDVALYSNALTEITKQKEKRAKKKSKGGGGVESAEKSTDEEQRAKYKDKKEITKDKEKRAKKKSKGGGGVESVEESSSTSSSISSTDSPRSRAKKEEEKREKVDKAKRESEEVTCLSEETIAGAKRLESKVKDWKDKKGKDDIGMKKKTKGIEGKDVSSDVEEQLALNMRKEVKGKNKRS